MRLTTNPTSLLGISASGALSSPARWFINGGAARGVGTDSARARAITVYTDVAEAAREIGLPATDTIAVLLVAPSGRRIAREHDGFENEKTQRLGAVLKPQDEDNRTQRC